MELIRDRTGNTLLQFVIPLTDPNTGNFVPALTGLNTLGLTIYWSTVAGDFVASLVDPVIAETVRQGYYKVVVTLLDLVNLDIEREAFFTLEDNQPTKRWRDQSILIDLRGLYNRIATIDQSLSLVNDNVNTILADVTTIKTALPAGLLTIASQDDILNLDQRVVGMNPNVPTRFALASTGIFMMRIVCTFHNDGGVLADPNADEIAYRLFSRNDQDFFPDTMYFKEVGALNLATPSPTYPFPAAKMEKISTGFYELYVRFDSAVHFSTLPNQLTHEFYANEDSPPVELMGIRNTMLESQAETGFLVNLISNNTNKAVIAEAIKNFDSDSIVLGANSIEARIRDTIQVIIDKLPSTGLISNIDKSTIFDGITYDTIVQTLYGDIAGRKLKDVISASVEHHTIFKQNNTSQLLKKSVTDSEQIRIV